ncbi:MAG: tetratricopeptide repeat protein [Ardenticatenia bacterium]|nr:MAG: tetratricopeptide repeat protein [Ardenticatenia bacterium]
MRQTLRTRWNLVVGLLGSLILLFALWRAGAPTWLLWAYNIERAGYALDRALVWPEPRLSDSLPMLAADADEATLRTALAHLAAAMRWRPDHFHAYRLAGHLYAAQHDWIHAAESLAQAAQREPRNPLLPWEEGLMYEQMALAVERAPREAMLAHFADGAVEAPAVPLDTPFCQGNDLRTCYVGRTEWALPPAHVAGALPESAPVLFTHPPVKVRAELTIPAQTPALLFRHGLAPEARDYGTDGATFQVWVETPDGATMVYERTVDGETARRGWVWGVADLSPWVGQAVTVVLVSGPGPSGNTQGDWYGWGDLVLTTPRAARYAQQAPRAQMRAVWLAAGFTPDYLVQRALESLTRLQDPADARRWAARIIALDPTQPHGYSIMADAYAAEKMWAAAAAFYRAAAQRAPDVRDHIYNAARMEIELGNLETAANLLEQTPNLPLGAMPRSVILYELGNLYRTRLRDPERALQAYDRAIEWHEWGNRPNLEAETHVQRGNVLRQLRDYEAALAAYRAALALNPEHYWAIVGEAQALHALGQSDAALARLDAAIALNPNQAYAFNIKGDILRALARIDEARAAYQAALERDPDNRALQDKLNALENQSSP